MKAINVFKPLDVTNRVSTALLLLRLVAGLAFMFHGYGKIQNPGAWMGPDAKIPAFLQVLAAVSEFGGGACWMLGFLTPLASFGITCTMAVAFSMHAFVFGDPFVSKGSGGAYELASIYFCIAVLLLTAGPGRFSLDRVIFGKKLRLSAQPRTDT